MDLETAQFRSRRLQNHAPSVGLIAMHFNETEHRFQGLVAAAFELSPRAAPALIAQAGSQALADMLKIAARQDGRAELAFALPYAARLFDACRSNRNLFIHGIYSNPSIGPADEIAMRKTTARGGVRPGEWAVPVAELEQVVAEIIATGDFLEALTERLLSGEADGAWPDAPPMPARRFETLELYAG